MHNNEYINPYQTSLGNKLFQYVMDSFGQVLLHEEKAAWKKWATGADCTTGISSLRMTLYKDIVKREQLPRFVKIAYVEAPTEHEQYPLGQLFYGDRVLRYVLAGIEYVVPNSKAEVIGFDVHAETAYLEVVVDDLSIVEREFLATTFAIEYEIKGG